MVVVEHTSARRHKTAIGETILGVGEGDSISDQSDGAFD